MLPQSIADRRVYWALPRAAKRAVTRNQVELMRVDTVSSPDMSGFGELGFSPRSVEDMLRELLQNEGPKGRIQE